jgi:hypothetical protein
MISAVASQAAGAAVMAGALYAGAAVLCEVNTFHDIWTSISASSGETPILLGVAAFAGYSFRERGPPLIVVPLAAIGGGLMAGGVIVVWEYAGGYLRLHNHTDEQKRKHAAGLALAGAMAAVAGTMAETLAASGKVPVTTLLTGVSPSAALDLD